MVGKSGGLTATFEEVSWGSVMRVQGRLAQAPLGKLIDVVKACNERHRHLAAVCDYSQAALALDPRQLLRCARAAAAGSLDWPTALVVPTDEVSVWQEFAYLQGMQGSLRRVFADHGAARVWCIEQAGLRLAQIRSHASW